MEKTALSGLLPEQIAKLLPLEKPFRSKQIFEWISKGVNSLEKMSNLPKSLIKDLSEKAVLCSCSVSDILKDEDGSVKLQITTFDNFCVETVLLIDKANRKTACLSCQVGCAMNCAFCKTGSLGFARNLCASEIVEQFLFLETECGKIDNIVFMGMGEPMMNLGEIRKAISILSDKRGRNFSIRRITISTVGIVSGIYDLADSTPHTRLAVSITVADEKIRREIIPSAKNNSLIELKKAIFYYSQKTGKRVTLEIALLSKINTTLESASSLIDFAKNLDVNINLIPWNVIPTLPFQSPSKQEVLYFVSLLEKANLNVTVRMHRGGNISGACGQLGKV